MKKFIALLLILVTLSLTTLFVFAKEEPDPKIVTPQIVIMREEPDPK